MLSTSTAKASAKSSNECRLSIISTHSTARAAADPIIIVRRPPSRRSRNGPMSGARTANGAIVRSRYSATRARAASGEIEKKREPASAMATRVSPAANSACARANRANGRGMVPPPSPGRNGRQPSAGTGRVDLAIDVDGTHRELLKGSPPDADPRPMSDLSQLLGALYADGGPSPPATAPPAAAPAAPEAPETPIPAPAPIESAPEPLAPASAPSWSSEAALDEAFATWVPGPTADAHAAERSIVAGVLDTQPVAAVAPLAPRAPAPLTV